MAKEKRTRDAKITWSRFFWCTVSVVLWCVVFTGFAFSSFRPFFAAGRFRPELVSGRGRSGGERINAVSWDPHRHAVPRRKITVRGTVALPDQILVFLNYPSPARIFTKEDLYCVYSSPNNRHQLAPTRVENLESDGEQIVRCPLPTRGDGSSSSPAVSVAFKSDRNPPRGDFAFGGSHHRWGSLVYEAVIDRDNTTVVFVKGFNLRPDKLYEPSRFECLYGWDFSRPKFVLRAEALSAAQEIVRCVTPLSVLGPTLPVRPKDGPIKVSVRMKGRPAMDSIAQVGSHVGPQAHNGKNKEFEMCVCTMLRNQAKPLKEWAIYHARIGVQRFFVYDNNSDDEVEDVIASLDVRGGVNISRHVWPWIKTQEAGFAHCALRARGSCEWVGFIDVDEFLYLPDHETTLVDVVRNQSESGDNVAELRVSCFSFGPSGLKAAPEQGVMAGYTCRLAAPERHKSIINPEALNSSMINLVHHFHLRDGFNFVNADRGALVINHYKYQVWDVFKEKFYRRVATYVADWQNDKNVGSKDRAPGLGTRPVEPPDWSSQFCEVNDVGLRDMVMQRFSIPATNLLPWQESGGGSSQLGT